VLGEREIPGNLKKAEGVVRPGKRGERRPLTTFESKGEKEEESSGRDVRRDSNSSPEEGSLMISHRIVVSAEKKKETKISTDAARLHYLGEGKKEERKWHGRSSPAAPGREEIVTDGQTEDNLIGRRYKEREEASLVLLFSARGMEEEWSERRRALLDGRANYPYSPGRGHSSLRNEEKELAATTTRVGERTSRAISARP